MDKVDPEFVERYQKLYEEDPKSRVFAPLAEAYRKMGLLKEALELCKEGLKLHPQFAGGRIALGRVLVDLKRDSEAVTEFQQAVGLSPDNVLAHTLLAEALLRLKRPKDALHAYKMLLFLAPENDKAKTAVQKLESLTADEYDDDVFEMRPLPEAVKDWQKLDVEWDDSKTERTKLKTHQLRNLERVLSLADAYIVRNDIDRAANVLTEGERTLGSNPEIVKRMKLIHHRQLDNIPHPKKAQDIKEPPSRERLVLDSKIEFLQDLLARIKKT